MNNSQHPIVSAIVAMSENRVIGKNNQLPWHLPADLKHFKTITSGHPILMGRKTYESIGKPLPNRTNIIITRDKTFTAPGCIMSYSIHEAVQQAASLDEKEIFIIGGAEIFRESMAALAYIYLTIVHHQFDGDIFFPELNPTEWKEIERIDYAADEKNLFAYSFLKLERIT